MKARKTKVTENRERPSKWKWKRKGNEISFKEQPAGFVRGTSDGDVRSMNYERRTCSPTLHTDDRSTNTTNLQNE